MHPEALTGQRDARSVYNFERILTDRIDSQSARNAHGGLVPAVFCFFHPFQSCLVPLVARSSIALTELVLPTVWPKRLGPLRFGTFLQPSGGPVFCRLESGRNRV